LEQRRAGRWCRCLTKTANTTEENSDTAGIQTELQSVAKMLMTTTLVWLIHPTPTTELEDQQDSILPDIETALVPMTTTAWKTAQRLFNWLAYANL
jgi:hypothetical protein